VRSSVFSGSFGGTHGGHSRGICSSSMNDEWMTAARLGD